MLHPYVLFSTVVGWLQGTAAVCLWEGACAHSVHGGQGVTHGLPGSAVEGTAPCLPSGAQQAGRGFSERAEA